MTKLFCLTNSLPINIQGFELLDAGLVLHLSLLLHFFWELYVLVLQGMLGCGCLFVQMFESLVLQDGLQEKHCRFVSYYFDNCLNQFSDLNIKENIMCR